MSTIIQYRRDTAANWTSANPTLLAGEVGYETDTAKLKVGDGSTAWTALAYYSAGAHKTTHQNGGADEITVAGLDGLLADDQHVLDTEALAAAEAGAASAATASKLVIRDISARAKFAAPGATGDTLIKGTRVTTAELPAMTDEKIWKGTGGNVEEVDVYTDAAAVAAIEAAGLTFAENKGIILDAALSADGKYSGIVEAGTAGTALAFGDIVYFAVADSKWELAKANAAATSAGKIGICVLAANEDAATVILLYGKVRADEVFPNLTVGAPVHISAATAGDIVVAAPSGTTNFVVRIIGYGNTADELFFCPDNTYVELS